VAGFSALSEQLDADGVGDVLRRVIGPQVEEIEAAGGQIDKYMGDGVMAFWLCPDAARLARAAADAAAAAERAVARVSDTARRDALKIGIRIGLHAGEVAVGDFGGGQRIAFTLVGQVVNAAARYEQYKPKPGNRDGAIRLSDVVYGLLPQNGRGGFHPEPVAFVDKHDRPFTAYLSHV
jgi:class 3 adenylate cyclase